MSLIEWSSWESEEDAVMQAATHARPLGRGISVLNVFWSHGPGLVSGMVPAHPRRWNRTGDRDRLAVAPGGLGAGIRDGGDQAGAAPCLRHPEAAGGDCRDRRRQCRVPEGSGEARLETQKRRLSSGRVGAAIQLET